MIRINKFLADHGVASRRAVDELIARGRVAVNGEVLEKPGRMIGENDRVTVDKKEIRQKLAGSVYILLNKPLDCITTTKDTHGRKTVLDYVKSDVRVFPIGRLDKNTTGALLLTNDGDLAHMLMHPRYSVEKEYRAHIDRVLEEKDKKIFENGIMLDGVKTSCCVIRLFQNDKTDVVITIHEGKNRQIHRMFGSLGYKVQQLERIRYADLSIRGLQQGEWRHLTAKEVDGLKNIRK